MDINTVIEIKKKVFLINFSAQMAEKIVNITNPEIIRRIKKIAADKKHIHQKIKEGKISEIKSDIKFAHPLSTGNHR